jgi:hypothetical protein
MLKYIPVQQYIDQSPRDQLMSNLLKDVEPEILMAEKSISKEVDNIIDLGEDPITTIGAEL